MAGRCGRLALRYTSQPFAYVPQMESVDWELPGDVGNAGDDGCPLMGGNETCLRITRPSDAQGFVRESLERVDLWPCAMPDPDELSHACRLAGAYIIHVQLALRWTPWGCGDACSVNPFAGVDNPHRELMIQLFEQFRA